MAATPSISIGLSLIKAGQSTLAPGSSITNDAGPLTVGVLLSNIDPLAVYTITITGSETTVVNGIRGTTNVVVGTAVTTPGVSSLGIRVADRSGPTNLSALVRYPDNGSASSNTIGVYELPAPIAGVTTAGFSSSDYAAITTAGYKMNFIDGTTAIQLTDGVIGLGRGTTEALLQRLYAGLLNRAGDSGGLAYYKVQLTSGVGIDGVASQIMAGPEYARSHGTQSDPQFVDTLYRGFVGRSPAPGEAQAAIGELVTGTSRATLAASFATSIESSTYYAPSTASVFVRDGVGTMINEAYRTAFAREVDAGGLATYRALLSAGGTAPDFYKAIAQSAEFQAIHASQTNKDFVFNVYQAGLGRSPDGNGQANYVQQLEAGLLTRAGVVQAVSTSAEVLLRLPTAL